MGPVVDAQLLYFTEAFAKHGPTPQGVDWQNWETLALHYDKMLAVLTPSSKKEKVTLLDVGCGWGGLLARARSQGIELDYTGIDLVPEMTAYGRTHFPDAEFITTNILDLVTERKFDYVVANGTLTEKLDVSLAVFDEYARRVIRRMFALSNIGIAFNVMTSYVNFFAPNLFYKNPLEMIAFCATELSPSFRIDHAYQHYDYTTYVYQR